MIRNYLIFISFISLPLFSSVVGFRLHSARHQLKQYSPLKSTVTTDVDSETKTKEKKIETKSDLDEKYLSLDVVPEKEKKPKKRPKRELNKPPSGFIYTDEDGSYDVPFLDEPRWFRVLVRKSSEKRLCEELLEYREEEQWKDILYDAFVPLSSYVRMKGNIPELAFKPMTPGTIYVKTKMSPDIADSIEKIEGIYKFTKSHRSYVVPLSDNEEEQIESIRDRVLTIEPGIARLRKEEYVSILSGSYAGRYGILMGAKNGKLQVCLRKEDSVDQWDYFDPNQLEYLANPPEKKWKTMTAKEAVESLLSKDPNHSMIWTLKKQGLLQEILHSDPSSPGSTGSDGRTGTRKKSFDARGAGVGESLGSSPSPSSSFVPGREKRIRSIAKEDDRRRAGDSSLGGSGSGSTGSGLGLGRQREVRSADELSEFESDLFKGDFEDIGGGGARDPWSNARGDRDVPSARSGDVGNEFDSFIEDLLSQLDEDTSVTPSPPPLASGTASKPSSASSPPRTSTPPPAADLLEDFDFDLERGHSDFKLPSQGDVSVTVTARPRSTAATAATSSTKSSNDATRGGRDRGGRETSAPRDSDRNQAVSPVTTSSPSSAAAGEISDADRLDSERVLEELLADIGRSSSSSSSSSSSGITKTIANSDNDNANNFLKDMDESDFLDELYGSSSSGRSSSSSSGRGKSLAPGITKPAVSSYRQEPSSRSPPLSSTTTTTRQSFSDRPPENKPTRVYVPKSREVIIEPVNNLNDDELPDSIFDFGSSINFNEKPAAALQNTATYPTSTPPTNKPEKNPSNRLNRNNENKEPNSSSNNNNNNNNNALKLEDFSSFEDYLDALVAHQKGGGGGATEGTEETDPYYLRKSSKPLTNTDKNKQQISLKNSIKISDENKVSNNDFNNIAFDEELDALFSTNNNDNAITNANKLSPPSSPSPVTPAATAANSKAKKTANPTRTPVTTSTAATIPESIRKEPQQKTNQIENDIFDDEDISSLFNTLTSTESSTSTSNNQRKDTASSTDINWEDFINNLDLSETGNNNDNNINNMDRDIFNEIFDIEDTFSESPKNKENIGNKKSGIEFEDDEDDSNLSGFLETIDWLDDADTQKKTPTKGNSYQPNRPSSTINRQGYNTNNNNNRYESNNRNINSNNNGRDFSNNNNDNKPKKVWQPKSMSSPTTSGTVATTSTSSTPAAASATLPDDINNSPKYKEESPTPLSNIADEVSTVARKPTNNNIASKSEAVSPPPLPVTSSSSSSSGSSSGSGSPASTDLGKISSKKQSDENYTVVELKDICKKNKLPVSGKKNELMERLEAAGLL